MLALRRRPNRDWLAACEMSIRESVCTMKRDEALEIPMCVIGIEIKITLDNVHFLAV